MEKVRWCLGLPFPVISASAVAGMFMFAKFAEPGTWFGILDVFIMVIMNTSHLLLPVLFASEWKIGCDTVHYIKELVLIDPHV
jgi:hypothetical protein